MSGPTAVPHPTATPARPAVSNTVQLVEGAAILTPIATIVGWLVTLVSVEIPAPVQNAIVALVVVVGNVAFSELRNRGHLTRAVIHSVFLGPVVGVLFLGCVSWNGSAFNHISQQEEIALRTADPDQPIEIDRCSAMQLGSAALLDEDGDETSVRLPMFAGRHVAEFAAILERNAAICAELARRDADRGVSPDLRQRNRAGWAMTWAETRRTLGGGDR